MPLSKTLTLVLATAVDNGIAESQDGTADTALDLNGSLVSGGIATLDSGGASRQVEITSAGNDSGITFLLTGTDRYGRVQSETITGADAGSATSVKNYKTVTSIVPSGNTASTVTAGTDGVGSTDAWLLDQWANPQSIGVSATTDGTVTYSIQAAADDFSPNWDLNNNEPDWQDCAGWSQLTADQSGALPEGPWTMVRLTIYSGAGSVTAKLLQAYAGRTT